MASAPASGEVASTGHRGAGGSGFQHVPVRGGREA